jgi:diguanylate cyclase (GGDEF)-like protein
MLAATWRCLAGRSVRDHAIQLSDAHVTPPVTALGRWLAEPGRELPAPIRAVLLAELFASPMAVLAALANGLLLNATALFLHQGSIFLVFMILDALALALRMGIVVACTRAIARRQPTLTDLYLFSGILWCTLQGAMVCAAMRAASPPLHVLCAATAMGLIGPICARNYAAPRLAMLLICMLDASIVAGAALSGNRWLLILAVQSPLLLFGCVSVIRRFHGVSVAALMAQNESHHQARHDSLTGLGNRVGLAEALARMADAEEEMAVFCLDLDGFKQVNDRLGHQAGDRLLQAVARRLAATTRSTDILARLGGDEFIIVVPGMRPPDAQRFAEALIRRVMDKGYVLDDGPPVQIGLSVGVACSPDDGVGLTELYRRADAHLYEAKAAGKGVWRGAAGGAPPGPQGPDAAQTQEKPQAPLECVGTHQGDGKGQGKVLFFPRR